MSEFLPGPTACSGPSWDRRHGATKAGFVPGSSDQSHQMDGAWPSIRKAATFRDALLSRPDLTTHEVGLRHQEEPERLLTFSLNLSYECAATQPLSDLVAARTSARWTLRYWRRTRSISRTRICRAATTGTAMTAPMMPAISPRKSTDKITMSGFT